MGFVEQWGRVRQLEGGDDMYASSLQRIPGMQLYSGMFLILVCIIFTWIEGFSFISMINLWINMLGIDVSPPNLSWSPSLVNCNIFLLFIYQPYRLSQFPGLKCCSWQVFVRAYWRQRTHLTCHIISWWGHLRWWTWPVCSVWLLGYLKPRRVGLLLTVAGT